MTMGEGGAVYTDNPLLHKIIRSFRDWGRDCVCPPGRDNLCGHRFDRQYGELPLGLRPQIRLFSHFGYNLKATDMQAAIGCAQLKKFPSFVESAAATTVNRLRAALSEPAADKLILPEPAAEQSAPTWFGFLITVKPESGRGPQPPRDPLRGETTASRPGCCSAANLIKHPCFDARSAAAKTAYRVGGRALTNTDRIMADTFWVGVYPGMTDEKIDYMAKTIIEAVNQ